MQKCSYCGADLPENTRFCGKCGSVQDALVTDAATSSSNTLPPQSWASESGTIPVSSPPSSKDPTHGSVLAWSSNTQAPATPPPLAENEDEQTSGIPPWSPLYGAALGGDALAGSLQASTPGVPIVQGTPQISSAPSVAGTFTPSTNVPVSPPMHGPTSGSFSPPVQEAAQIPVSHPVQGPANAPSGNPPAGSWACAGEQSRTCQSSCAETRANAPSTNPAGNARTSPASWASAPS